MAEKIFYYVFFSILFFFIFLTNFDLIGKINEYLNSKKNKKIDIIKKKIFIPKHSGYFFRKNNIIPASDGTVFKIVYVLTIINYIHFPCTILLMIATKIFKSFILFVLMCLFVLIFSSILGVIGYFAEKNYIKREKEEGLNFKV